MSIIPAFYISIAVLVLYTWYHNFTSDPVNPALLETHTQNGNPYAHDTASGILENGHYVDLYICEEELEQEWNKLSDMPYGRFDLKGQVISSTIKRYLTSKGLRKDSAGLHALTSSDLFNIEKGQANFRFHDNPGIYQRLYETLWEIHVYIRIGFVQEHSIGQRLAFYRTALSLIREKPWNGTGPGDVYNLMQVTMQSANIGCGSRHGKENPITSMPFYCLVLVWQDSSGYWYVGYIRFSAGEPGGYCYLTCFSPLS